jgi:hypothetical protein
LAVTAIRFALSAAILRNAVSAGCCCAQTCSPQSDKQLKRKIFFIDNNRGTPKVGVRIKSIDTVDEIFEIFHIVTIDC